MKKNAPGGSDAVRPVLAVSATFIGTVVGAGFASGQEIYQFFSRHGSYGFWGLFLAVILLGFSGVKVFKAGYALKPQSYREFLRFILGPSLSKPVDLLLFVFLIVLIGVMLAGSGSIFESLSFNYWLGISLTALLLMAVLLFDLPGLISANMVVIPLMFTGSIIISLYGIHTRCAVITVPPFELNWVIAALQFSAYNLVLAVPVLLSLAQKYPSLPRLKWGSWLGGIGLGIMAGFIHWSILSHLPHLQQSALPMMELAKIAGKYPYWGYALVLWGEMFTTLLANTYGATLRLASFTGLPFRFWLAVVIISGIMIARAGFVNLIARCYPLFGFLALLILLVILIKKGPLILQGRP
ncbi:MAG: hypothetical protein ACM3X9_09410 [Bacillota bacterium]